MAKERTTGVVVDADTELRLLHTMLLRYVGGEIGAHTATLLVERGSRRLQRACFCQHGVCCDMHATHVSPHQHCPMR